VMHQSIYFVSLYFRNSSSNLQATIQSQFHTLKVYVKPSSGKQNHPRTACYSTQGTVHGFIRILLWCSPTFYIDFGIREGYIIMYLLAYKPRYGRLYHKRFFTLTMTCEKLKLSQTDFNGDFMTRLLVFNKVICELLITLEHSMN
jgi:hypothetical protein